MAKEKSKKANKINLGDIFKNFLGKVKKTPPEKKTENQVTEKITQEVPEIETPKPTKPSRPRLVTKATIQVSPEERVFQHIAVIGPSSGALNNMVQIMLRRGYDVEHIELQTVKKGTYERHELDKPIPPDCECLILFEPQNLDQAKTAINEIRKKCQLPMIAMGRRFSHPTWATEILKEHKMTDRFLIRFSTPALQEKFRHIRSQSYQARTQPPTSPVPPQKPLSAPKPTQPKESTPPPQKEAPPATLVEVPPSSEPAPEPKLVEVPPEELHADIVKKDMIISEETLRPMLDLASFAGETRARYRIIGRQDEKIDPDRYLTRREFESLFQCRFQEKWNIRLIQDPKAMPPILIELEKVTEDTSPSSDEDKVEVQPAKTVEPLPPPKAATPIATPAIQLDLTEKIKEVRKWWQAGRTTKIYNEMEDIRRSIPKIESINVQDFLQRFIPLIEGTVLFAKGRLDRTIENTLEELFHEDFSQRGLPAALRLLALVAAAQNPSYAEPLKQAEETLLSILSGLIPEESKRDESTASLQVIQDQLCKLDHLAENTFLVEKVTPPVIYEYFETLRQITSVLHKQFSIVDPELLMFGRLDKVIVRSQTRSDWAFDHSEASDEWQDRLIKFLHFLAEIRIEIYRAHQETALLTRMIEKGISEVVLEIARQPLLETLPGENLIRIDNEHLQEPNNKTVWHIDRHRGNYLIDLIYEEDPAIRAFVTFDEENIAYSWLGLYRMMNLSEKECRPSPTEFQEEQDESSL